MTMDKLIINYIKNTIIGMEEKDLNRDLRSGQICLGVKNKEEITVYMFIKHKSFFSKSFISKCHIIQTLGF